MEKKNEKNMFLDDQFFEEKKVEKQRVKLHASAGPAVAGKGRFGRDMVGKWVGMAGVQHARAHPRTSGWAGGLSRQSRKHRLPCLFVRFIRVCEA